MLLHTTYVYHYKSFHQNLDNLSAGDMTGFSTEPAGATPPNMPHGNSLHVADYLVFACLLLISLGIGVYYSLTGGRQKTTEEYLMGNRKLNVLPVTLSFTVSFISTILVLGYPAEIFSFGSGLCVQIFSEILGSVAACLVLVPLLYPLKCTTANQVGHYFLYLA